MRIYGIDETEKADFFGIERFAPFINLSTYGEGLSSTSDWTAAFALAIIDAQAFGVGLYIPPGVFPISASLVIPSNIRVFGAGFMSVVKPTGNLRPFVVDGVSGVCLERFKIQFTASAGTNSAGLRFHEATDCTYRDIYIDRPGLNGVEIANCERIHGERIQIMSPRFFGMFYLDSMDCSDTDFYIYEPGSFGHEFKNSKRCHSLRLKMIRPTAQHALTTWTGFGTPPEVPGAHLCEDCGWQDVYVECGPGTLNAIYITAARRCYVRGAKFQMYEHATFSGISISGNFFYNEGATITGDVTTGSPVILNVSDPDGQLQAGQRIHIANAGVQVNHTIVSVTLPTVTLATNVDVTTVGVVIGFVAKPDDATLEDIVIVGTNNASGGTDNIGIAGTTTDPLTGIVLRNVRSELASRFNLTCSHAEVRFEGGWYKNALGLQQWVLSAGAIVSANGVVFMGSQANVSYGIVPSVDARVRAKDCTFDGFGIGGLIATSDFTGIWSAEDCDFFNCKGTAALLRSGCFLKNCTFKDNRVGSGGFSGIVQVFGSGSQIDGCRFFLGGANPATDVDCYISEQAGATGNYYSNTYIDFLTNNIILAASSTSKIAPRFDTPITVNHSGSITLSFLQPPVFQKITLVGDATFITSTINSGRELKIKIDPGSSIRNLTFPAWRWLNAIPATLAASKFAFLTLRAFGTTDADIIARWDVEP
jgi:hypothetical protein